MLTALRQSLCKPFNKIVKPNDFVSTKVGEGSLTSGLIVCNAGVILGNKENTLLHYDPFNLYRFKEVLFSHLNEDSQKAYLFYSSNKKNSPYFGTKLILGELGVPYEEHCYDGRLNTYFKNKGTVWIDRNNNVYCDGKLVTNELS